MEDNEVVSSHYKMLTVTIINIDLYYTKIS